MNITELSAALRLPYIRDHWQQLLDEARQTKQDHAAFLETLLDMEWQLRMQNGQARRIKDAKFPLKKYLVDFQKNKYDEAFLPKFNDLETLDFIHNKENILLIGTPGAGKTHYATALGIAACMKGKSVLFATVPNLIVELKEAMSQNQLNAYRRKFERNNLVILDELGYVSFDKAGCELLFNLLSNRHGKGSVIITTNLSFENWESLFQDPVLTSAIIDRLAHKAHVLDISRDQGGRFEETLAWMANKPSPSTADAD